MSTAARDTRQGGVLLDARYDVVVAGARCAGASTAMLLARAGLRVLVVDPLPRGRDTLSTHALMRGAVVQLHRWGLLDAVRDAGTPPIRSTTFDYADETVTIPIKAGDGVDALYAPRRTVLDPILVGAAEDAGAHVVHGVALVDLVRDDSGRVRGAVVAGPDRVPRTVAADLVVGADGVRSRVARQVQAPFQDVAHHTAANVYGYFHGLDAPEFRWSFRPAVGTGTIPTNDGDTLVFASVTPEAFEEARAGDAATEALLHDTVRAVDPALAEAIRGAPHRGPIRAFAGIPGYLRKAVGPGWALVGDAGYFKDPLTAHGITDAFRDAELLARAVLKGGDDALRRYGEIRNAASRGLIEVTDRIASLTWSGDEIKGLHRRLSDEMKVDLEVIRGFPAIGGGEGEKEREPTRPQPRRRRSA